MVPRTESGRESLIHDRPTGQEPLLPGSSSLGLVRFRLWLALVTMFAIPIGIAAPVVFGLARDSGQSLFAPALAIIALAMGLGGLVVYLARRVLEPAEQLERTRVILEDAYDRARAESLRDALTGLGNHRGFQEEFERQWLIARRHGTPLALAMIDLDDFKRVNDQGGHGAGDRCLVAVRPDADRPAAPDRPGLPRRRRRVRDPAARSPTSTART